MNIITLSKIALGALTANGFVEREMNNPNINTMVAIIPDIALDEIYKDINVAYINI